MPIKKATLLMDRGSRELKVREELGEMCGLVKRMIEYDVVEFAFVEVARPTIAEGVKACLDQGVEQIVAIPYFLYHGKKERMATEEVRRLAEGSGRLRIAIGKPLWPHYKLAEMVVERIRELKGAWDLEGEDFEALLIGHGSIEQEANKELLEVAEAAKRLGSCGKVEVCYLELAHPSITEGIELCLSKSPASLLIVPYFLHFGAHLKKDIPAEVDVARRRHPERKIVVGRHLGADPKLAEVVVERIREAEANLNGAEV